MKPIYLVPVAVISTIAVLALQGPAAAQQSPEKAASLLQMWDSDSDGTVTLAEVQTRRADIFTAFDSNGDDILTAAEMEQMDEMRAIQQEEMGGGQGQGKGKGEGNGNGQGKGEGKGQGQGKGHGNGHGQDQSHGMGGDIARTDFVAKSADWLAKKDSNGDGVITAADFES